MEKLGGWTVIFLFLGAIFTFLGAWFTARDQTNAAKAQAKASGELKQKSDLLAKKSDEIASLTKINADIVTGGDSYCFLRAVVGNDGHVKLTIDHRGKYPTYDVFANVTDLSSFGVPKFMPDPNNPRNPHQIPVFPKTPLQYHFGIGNVVNGSNNDVGSVPIVTSNQKSFSFMITIIARNGFIQEMLDGSRTEDGNWQMKILVNKIDPETHKIIPLYAE